MPTRRHVLAGLAVLPSFSPAFAAGNPLRSVKTWMYLLQRLEEPALIEQAAASNYDLFVIEPGLDFKDGAYDAAGLVKALRTKPDGNKRLLLAYIDIGQAEDFRSYWARDWKPPTSGKPGFPEFLLAPDPDGWAGDYGVAYWHPEWKSIWLGENGLISRLAKRGFDGVYMDWVAACEEQSVRRAAAKAGLDPAREMMSLIKAIRTEGQKVNPDFLVVPQNAADLIDSDPEFYAAIIDGLGVEDTWHRGSANASWNSKRAGDLKPSGDETTARKIASYLRYLDRGIPVFTIDYCVSKKNAARVYKEAQAAGLVPLVTRVSLDHMTETPPPELRTP
ncbi:MAG: glycoside hydrolase, end-alpha-1,4-polygalactosaminidase [Rhizobiales bacterium]|nr:glycoside hydrolase, end-alpha-1,4-polygalactosaminidase [Hyphomicrobiales bacterium]